MKHPAKTTKGRAAMKALLKSITWRMVAATATMTIVYTLTGDFGSAGATAAIASPIKMLLYTAHDAVWAKWGTAPAPTGHLYPVVGVA